MNDMIEPKRSPNSSRGNIAIGFVVGWMLGALIDTFTGDTGIATVLGMLVGTILGARSQPGTYLMVYPRGTIQMLIFWGVIFLVFLIASAYLISNEITGLPRIVLALIPVIPGSFFILSIGKAISSLDEIQRRVQLEAIAIGFAITSMVALTCGLLGVIGETKFNWIFIVYVMIFGWFLGKLWTRRKYRIKTN